MGFIGGLLIGGATGLVVGWTVFPRPKWADRVFSFFG
jgi:hypothetical protein